MSEKVFVLPKNDLEAVEIAKLLKDNGFEEGKDFFITEQAWGASWEGLEDDIKEKLAATNAQIYGVELAGNNPYNAINVDHHNDRASEKSSIEQVAEIIGVELTTEQKFVAANDSKFIPGMMELADKLGMDKSSADAMIAAIRAKDRAAQGITQEQEKQAEEALANIEHKNGYDVVHLAHGKCATVTDRLYGQYENLLIMCGDGEVDFYGKGAVCNQIYEEYALKKVNDWDVWKGGDLSRSGFAGITGSLQASEADVKNIIENELAIEGLLNDEANFAKDCGAAPETSRDDVGGEER